MRLGELQRQAELRLQGGAHPDRARLDATFLLQEALNQPRTWLLIHNEDDLDQSVTEKYLQKVERRLTGEPIQYLLGKTEFFGLPFTVNPAVLIPRPETEHLVEKALELAGRFTKPRIIDIGTGSGAIAVSVAHSLPEACLTAVDISPKALEVARENARLNGVGIDFQLGDLLSSVAGSFELILSNPPYIPESDRPTLAVEVREHEPELALFAGVEGLDIYCRLIPQAFAKLHPGGWLLLEIGIHQAPAIRQLLFDAGFTEISFVPDLQGIERVACAQRPVG